MRSGKGSTQTFQCKNLQLTKSSCQTSDVFQQWLFLRKKFSLESKVWSFYLFENLPLSVKLSRVLLLPFTLSQRLQIFWELKCAVLKIISAPAKIDAFSDKVQAKSRFFRPHFHKDCKIKLIHVPSLWSLRIWCKTSWKYQITESRIFLFAANILEIEMCRLENSFGARKNWCISRQSSSKVHFDGNCAYSNPCVCLSQRMWFNLWMFCIFKD